MDHVKYVKEQAFAYLSHYKKTPLIYFYVIVVLRSVTLDMALVQLFVRNISFTISLRGKEPIT